MISPFRIHICYLHPADYEYALKFQQLIKGDCLHFTDSKGIGDDLSESQIKDNHIRNAVATAVLIGTQSAESEQIDREIFASLMKTDRYLHTGLFGVLLPSCSKSSLPADAQDLIPPRLADNLSIGFADLYKWRDDSSLVRAWFQHAVSKRDTILPDNSRMLLNQNLRHTFLY